MSTMTAQAFTSDDPDSEARCSDDRILKNDIVVGTIAGDEVRHATQIEHNLGFWEALNLYRTAAGWSIFFSLGIVMTAFDPQLLGMSNITKSKAEHCSRN